jgi:hypothetical protein
VEITQKEVQTSLVEEENPFNFSDDYQNLQCSTI